MLVERRVRFGKILHDGIRPTRGADTIIQNETNHENYVTDAIKKRYTGLKTNSNSSTASGPLVSVTIPTLNSAKTIRGCLDSIQQQTYRNVEVIVMDGGSTDDTVNVARSAGARVYFGTDLAQRRLLGVRMSQGQYVLMMDSDQVLDPAALEMCCRTCNDSGCDALVLPEVPIAVTSYVQRTIALDRYLIYHYSDAHPILGTGLARFFNRDFLIHVTWPEHVNANDHAWIHYACWRAGGKIGFSDAVLFHHDPRTLAEYSRKFYYWGYHYTRELGTNLPVTLTHALPRRVYVSKLALKNPLILGLVILYLTKMISGGLGGGKYIFERLWSKIKHSTVATRSFSPVSSPKQMPIPTLSPSTPGETVTDNEKPNLPIFSANEAGNLSQMVPGNMSNPDLTILIPTKDRIHDLQRLVRSLENQSDKSFHILIVNNGGPEIVKAIENVSQELSIRIVADQAQNLPHLFNHGLTSVNSGIVAYLNDDTEVNPSWVHEIRQTFAEYSDVAAVGGPAIDQNRQLMQKTQKWMQRRLLTRVAFRIVNSVLYEGKFFAIGYMSSWGTYSIGGSMSFSAKLPGPLIVNALSITNMAVRRNFLERLGGFDENFRFSATDGDLFVRLRKMGAKLLFNPKLSVLHYSSPTQGNSGTRSAFWLSRDYLLFLRKLNPTGLNDRLRGVLVLIGFVSFWAWHGISSGRPGVAVSSLDGLRAGMRVHLTVDGHNRHAVSKSSPTQFATRI